jgi:hypothetical protein
MSNPQKVFDNYKHIEQEKQAANQEFQKGIQRPMNKIEQAERQLNARANTQWPKRF